MHAFEASRQTTLAALGRYAQARPEVEALWLQGSLARGDADPFSDIDAYLAIRDEAFDAAWAGREALLAALGPRVLAWSSAAVPGMPAVHALMEGGVRLDLFFERASAAPKLPRPIARPMVDKSGLIAQLDLSWRASPAEVGRVLQTIIRMTRQGATWPLRVLGRGQWGTLAKIELDLINAQVAQLMAVAHDPANFYRNPNALAALLTEVERNELTALTADALTALAARDLAALKTVHSRIGDALVAHGKAACAALGVEYPIGEAEEAEIRSLIAGNWPR